MFEKFENFGEFVKSVRQRRKYSLDLLSFLTGISEGHLSYLERKKKDPTLKNAVKILKALDVNERLEICDNISEMNRKKIGEYNNIIAEERKKIKEIRAKKDKMKKLLGREGK